MDKTKSSHEILNMYKDLTYFDNYIGSVLCFIVLIILLFISFSYFQVMAQIAPIKDDWVAQRCSPKVIPFAGIINKPDNMGVIDFTQQNFTYCMQNILTSITGFAVQPLTYITDSLTSLFDELSQALQYMRNILTNIRTSIGSITQEILGRVLNIMTPLKTIIIAVVDSMQKVNGVLTAGLYTSLGTYYTLKSLLGAIVQFIIIILIIMVSLILGMWLLPFTWPVAMTMTAVFTSIAIPLAIIIGFMTDVLHVQTDMSIPGIPMPACFDRSTNIKMNDGTSRAIFNIEVGDRLWNNVLVTATMKLDAKKAKMYNLNGVIVSDTHIVKHEGKWISVSDYPNKIAIDNYKEPFLYCLNTENKEICINNITFADWDELTSEDIQYLLSDPIASYKKKHIDEESAEFYNNNAISISTLDIHKYFDGGFVEDTMIPLLDGSMREIKNIQIGDILSKGEKVYGLVEIDGRSLCEQYVYNLGPACIFKGGPNLNICDQKFAKMNDATTTMNLDKNKRKKKIVISNKLYHLLTDSETFYVNDLKFYHYNSNIELFLDRYRGKLLSMKYV